MPLCSTKYHGEIEYSPDAVLHFPGGIFGFESESSFLAIDVPSARPIVFLQSLETPGLSFMTLPVRAVDPDYHLALGPADLTVLGYQESEAPRIGEDVLCLALITVQAGRPTTANLLAPVVVNLSNRQAVQAISCDIDYSHQHILMEAAQEQLC